ncbi:catalase family peroxidase [Amycolatopsis jejuensis]|uniref:catalase family peroxidase n=1 Tax=Amycolatopsis jejuensis TaxID=330084 RepID=UPI00052578E5|nr:catalase family peroxidase [Amycolatopsis jejuensis]
MEKKQLVSRRNALLGIAGIAAVDVGAFLGVTGRLGTPELTPAAFADRFEQVYGKHEGFRRNHAKGVSVAGRFESNGAGTEVCSAFRTGEYPVTGRFSLSGGMPYAPDAAATVRGLGLRVELPHGEQWRTAMVNIPVFLDRTPEGFADRIVAYAADPATGKPDPQRTAEFLRQHPETVKAMAYVKAHPPSPGFADSTFHGLNAFLATNDDGNTVPIRWTFEPVGLTTTQATGSNHLFDAAVEAVRNAPLRWQLVLTIAEPGDPTGDATTPWPGNRRRITAGTLTLSTVETEATGNARDVNFDPTVLPSGLAVSDDPLLSARSAVYARSYERRTGEPKHPSAVQVREVPA